MSLTATQDRPMTQVIATATTLDTLAIGAKMPIPSLEERGKLFLETLRDVWGRKLEACGPYKGRSEPIQVRCSKCGTVHDRMPRYLAEGFSFDCSCGRLKARKRVKNSRAARLKAVQQAKERIERRASEKKPVSTADSHRLSADQILRTFSRRG
jgi:hypothetical protein